MKTCCLCLVAAAAVSTVRAESATKFASVAQASAAFATNSAAVREDAYRYVAAAVRTADEKNLKLTLATLRTMSASLGRVAEYDAACEAGMASESEPVRLVCAAALLLSPGLAADPAGFVSRAERVMGEPDAALSPLRIELVRAVAAARAQKLSDVRGALGLLDESVARAGGDKAGVLQLRLKRLEILQFAKMDAEIEREARLILSDGDCPLSASLPATFALADLAVARKDAKSAGELLLGAVRMSPQPPLGIAKRLVDANVGTETMDAAVAEMRAKLARMPLGDASVFRAAVERTQPEVVELLVHAGRGDEALAECRVLVLTASPRAYQAAVSLTAATLKRVDGNLGRALAFLDFQRKGLVPKTRNVLLDAPALADEVRTAARKSLPTGARTTWTERLAVSARLVWLDDPLAATEEALRAFSLAPFDGKALQACADAVVQPVLTVTRDPDAAKRIVDYLMHGAVGADGVKGTQDDLPSPFGSLAEVLNVGSGD